MTVHPPAAVGVPLCTFVTPSSELTAHEQRPQRVSALARRIHGWTWQAVSFALLTIYIPVVYTAIVSDRNGHRRRLCYTVRTGGQARRSSEGRNSFLLPQYGPLSPQYFNTTSPSYL